MRAIWRIFGEFCMNMAAGAILALLWKLTLTRGILSTTSKTSYPGAGRIDMSGLSISTDRFDK